MTGHRHTARTDFAIVADLSDDSQVLAVALASMEAAGCTCSPAVALWRAQQRIEIRHDAWCPVMTGGAS